MQQTPVKSNKDPSNTASMPGMVLPRERTQALQHLIKLTKNLANLAERESKALTQNDMLSFAILQDEKVLIAERYAKASEEFRNRLPEFRGIDGALLNRLQGLQEQLGEVSRQNNEVVKRLYERSRENTQATLLNAQELGQSKKITFANSNTEEGRKNA